MNRKFAGIVHKLRYTESFRVEELEIILLDTLIA